MTTIASRRPSLATIFSYVVIGAITVFNCAGVLFAGALAVPGDGGSANGVITVWAIGFCGVAASLAVAIALCRHQQRLIGIVISGATLPLLYAASLLTLTAKLQFDLTKPNSNAFIAACSSAGTHFLKAPDHPVRSIAYDWSVQYPPEIDFFTIGKNSVTSSVQGGSPQRPPNIDFIEERCCLHVGQPTNGAGPYIRLPAQGEYFGIPELTADALATLNSVDVKEEDPESRLKQIDVIVTDRRDGTTLATLRYLLDIKKHRGCGETSPGMMDQQAFVAKAVGIDWHPHHFLVDK